MTPPNPDARLRELLAKEAYERLERHLDENYYPGARDDLKTLLDRIEALEALLTDWSAWEEGFTDDPASHPFLRRARDLVKGTGE